MFNVYRCSRAANQVIDPSSYCFSFITFNIMLKKYNRNCMLVIMLTLTKIRVFLLFLTRGIIVFSTLS